MELDHLEVKSIPIGMLEIEDRFMTQLSFAYGIVIRKIYSGDGLTEVEVQLEYPGGFIVHKTVHPDFLVNSEEI